MFAQSRIFTIAVIGTIALRVATCEAMDKLDPMDTINYAPVCYVLTEFISYYEKDGTTALEIIYTNYSNTSRTLMLFEEKRRKAKVTPTEISSNTTAVMFNKAAYKARKMLLNDLIGLGPQQATVLFRGLYNDFTCDRFNKPIAIDAYNFLKIFD